MKEGRICRVLELRHRLLLPSDSGAPGSWVFRVDQELAAVAPGSQAGGFGLELLHLAASRSRDFSASITV